MYQLVEFEQIKTIFSKNPSKFNKLLKAEKKYVDEVYQCTNNPFDYEKLFALIDDNVEQIKKYKNKDFIIQIIFYVIINNYEISKLNKYALYIIDNYYFFENCLFERCYAIKGGMDKIINLVLHIPSFISIFMVVRWGILLTERKSKSAMSTLDNWRHNVCGKVYKLLYGKNRTQIYWHIRKIVIEKYDKDFAEELTKHIFGEVIIDNKTKNNSKFNNSKLKNFYELENYSGYKKDFCEFVKMDIRSMLYLTNLEITKEWIYNPKVINYKLLFVFLHLYKKMGYVDRDKYTTETLCASIKARQKLVFNNLFYKTMTKVNTLKELCVLEIIGDFVFIPKEYPEMLLNITIKR